MYLFGFLSGFFVCFGNPFKAILFLCVCVMFFPLLYSPLSSKCVLFSYLRAVQEVAYPGV